LIGSPVSPEMLLPDWRNETLGAVLFVQTQANSLGYFANLLYIDNTFIWGPGRDQQSKSNQTWCAEGGTSLFQFFTDFSQGESRWAAPSAASLPASCWGVKAPRSKFSVCARRGEGRWKGDAQFVCRIAGSLTALQTTISYRCSSQYIRIGLSWYKPGRGRSASCRLFIAIWRAVWRPVLS